MACCLTAPSHYLNQCRLIISEVQKQTTEVNSQDTPQPSISKISWKITQSKTPFQSHMGQWINMWRMVVIISFSNGLLPTWYQLKPISLNTNWTLNSKIQLNWINYFLSAKHNWKYDVACGMDELYYLALRVKAMLFLNISAYSTWCTDDR